MSHQKKGPEKFAVIVLSRMPCCVSDIPVNQRPTLPLLERKELAFFDGVQWNLTEKGRAVVKNGVFRF